MFHNCHTRKNYLPVDLGILQGWPTHKSTHSDPRSSLSITALLTNPPIVVLSGWSHPQGPFQPPAPFTAYGSFRNFTRQNHGMAGNREAGSFVNSTVRLGGPAHEIMTKTTHKGGGGERVNAGRGKEWGDQGVVGCEKIYVMGSRGGRGSGEMMGA